MAFFVNPPEGTNHSLKCIKSKIGQHIYFKNFRKLQLRAKQTARLPPHEVK